MLIKVKIFTVKALTLIKKKTKATKATKAGEGEELQALKKPYCYF